MATGYTGQIAEGMNFDEFVWGCARAFWRDDYVPEHEPSPYYREELNRAKEELERIRTMTVEQAERECLASYQRGIESDERYLASKRELRIKYEAMLAKVETWSPPSPDHQCLKDFMKAQILDSIEHDCTPYPREAGVMESATDWLARQISNTEDDIKYYQEHWDEEVKAVKAAIEWNNELRESVPQLV